MYLYISGNSEIFHWTQFQFVFQVTTGFKITAYISQLYRTQKKIKRNDSLIYYFKKS